MLQQTTTLSPEEGDAFCLYTDIQGRILTASPDLLTLTGKHPHELIGHSLTTILDTTDAEKIRSVLNSLPESDQVTFFLTLQGKKIGQPIGFSVACKTQNNTADSILQWKALLPKQAGINITGTPVSLYNETFTQFADMAAMIWISDEQDNIVFINKYWYDYTGLDKDAFQACGIATIVHPHDINIAVEQYLDLVQQRMPCLLEYRLKKHTGEYRWVRVLGTPRFTEQGQFKGYIITATDINDSKVAEEISFFQVQAMNNISDVIIATDLQFNVTAFNRAAETTYGFEAADLLGRPIRDFIDHKYPDCTREEALKELYLNDRWEGLTYYDHTNGRRIYMHCSLVFIKDHEGKRIGVAGIHRDITKLREAETERIRQEQLLVLEKQVLEMNALPDISVNTITDYFLEGLESFFPGMLCSVLMLDDEKQRFYLLSAPSLPSEYKAIIPKIIPGSSVGSCGAAIFRKEKVISADIATDPLWEGLQSVTTQFGLQACWSFPIMNAQQEVLAAMAVYYKSPKAPQPGELKVLERVCNLLRIIIENKIGEARIRLSHERYLLITRVTNDAVWDWDVANSDHVHYGDGFYALFGYKTGYIQQSSGFWESCIHPEDRDRVVKRLDQFITSNKSRLWEDEYRFKKSNGDYALVHDRGFLIFDHEGRINRMIGSMQDITEKKELEAKLLLQELDKQKLVAQAVINAQEKERADIGKDLHDNVNQILTTAKLYLEMAKHEDADKTDLINRCSVNISDAINEIRSISRSLVPASIGDLGLVVSIQDLVENINATRRLEVAFHYKGRIDESIDEKRKLMLFRIIQEQVNNVLKHAGATRLIIELVLDEKMIALSIQDNGKGFEPEKAKGKKGVGLSNITSRTQLFNGKVTIIAAPGKGCTLNINVPI
jgi:PAS domain S-box-containing protein